MSFGFSVTDFIDLIGKANKIRREFIDAPSQFNDISNEVRSFAIVLQDVEVLSDRLSKEEIADLKDIISVCRELLKKLEKTLEKYGDIPARPALGSSTGERIKRVWKRLTWEPDDIRDLRLRITANVALLNAFQGKIVRQTTMETKAAVDRLHERRDTLELREEQQTILDWLTPADFAPQQSDFIRRRQEGTGIPGAGKTILTSIVIDELHNKYEGDATIGIAYVFCDFRRQGEQQPADLLASLLKQLAQRGSLPDSVQNLYSSYQEKRTRPSVRDLSETLQEVAEIYSRVFIIVDALDECQAIGRAKFLSEIFDLQENRKISFFATSRPIPEISDRFIGSLSLEIRASEQDVTKYVEGHMDRLPRFVARRPDLQEEIKIGIVKAVDGMFLLAQLHLNSLIGKSSPKALRVTLSKLPARSAAYDHAYRDAMERIEGQVSDQKELAKRILAWITCAKRPLTTTELRYALAVERGESELDEENLPEIEDMVSVCAGLVAFDEDSGIIRLVHYTTQEYFERTQGFWFPNAETEICDTCVTYLSFATLGELCMSPDELAERINLNNLYDYAAGNWGYHAGDALSLSQTAIDFLQSKKIEVASQTIELNANDKVFGFAKEFPRDINGLHLAAYFGLESVIRLFDDSASLNKRDRRGRTPLSYAASHGQISVVRALLASNGIEPDIGDETERTPLAWAADCDKEDVVKLLLAADRVDVNAKDIWGQTPLFRAAEGGHEAIVKLLLAAEGIEADMRDAKGETPLALAAEEGHLAIVELLSAAEGVDFDSKDNQNYTPLMDAVAAGHEAVVRLLLDKGADPNTQSFKNGSTALTSAMSAHHRGIVKLLLDNGVDIEQRDTNTGWTPLIRAAMGDDVELINLLLSKGADIEGKDSNYGRTALSLAAENGNMAAVQLLCDMGADLESKDSKHSRTALMWAAENGNEDVVELLLERGATTQEPGQDTPVACTEEDGDAAIATSLRGKRQYLET